MLSSLRSKLPFFYEIEGRYYIIGKNKVVNYLDEIMMLPKLSDLYDLYKEALELYKNKMLNDDDKYKNAIFIIITKCRDEVEKASDCNKNIESFWKELSESNKEVLFNQVEDFSKLYSYFGLNIVYPSLQYCR